MPTVLVGPSSQVRELLQEAARPGAPARVRTGGRLPARPRVGRPRPGARGLAGAGHVRRRTTSLLDVVRTHHAEAAVVAPPARGSPTPTCAAGARGSRTAASTSWSAPGCATWPAAGLRSPRWVAADLRPRAARRRCPVTGARLKGVVDRVVAAGLLVVFGPVLGLLTLLIRADSPGPAIYRQTRVGRHGRPFTVYKLRTMRVRRRPGPSSELAEAERVRPRRRALQDQARPTDHRDRVDAAGLLARRAAPAVERRPRRDVPRRTAAGATRRGAGLPRGPGPPARGEARHDGPLAGLGSVRPVVGRDRAARPAVRRQLVLVAGPPHRPAHRDRGAWAAGAPTERPAGPPVSRRRARARCARIRSASSGRQTTRSGR